MRCPDPQGPAAFVGFCGGSISPWVHATNHCGWTEGVGEVWLVYSGRAPRSWLRPRRVVKRARIASVYTGTARISVASRSAAPPTRLETRTKESNTHASHWVD